MTYKITITPPASQDVKDIIAWYNLQRPGVGKKFVFYFNKRVKLLKKFPVASSIRYKNVFIVTMEKFPYGIHYFINQNNETIVITGVYSHDRNLKRFRDMKD